MSQWSRGRCNSGFVVTVSAGDGYWDGYSGWVYRVGNTGYTQPARFARGGTQIQRSGPRNPSPAGEGGVGGIWVPGEPGCAVGRGRSCTTLRARSVPLQGPSLYRTLQGPTLARFRPQSCKVSKNDKVSPKSVEKASRSP